MEEEYDLYDCSSFDCDKCTGCDKGDEEGNKITIIEECKYISLEEAEQKFKEAFMRALQT